VDNESIYSAVKVFERVEKIRKACQIRLTHLEKNRQCLTCGKDFMPRRHGFCPDCGSENTRAMKVSMKCQDCGLTWQPDTMICPNCGSTVTVSHPKTDEYMRDIALPRLRTEEDFYEKQMRNMVHGHPVWDWAKGVKGIGETTLGRIVSKTDIVRCKTVSEYWAHCGFGLDGDGKPQRKRAGETINYNQVLRSDNVMCGESLLRATDKYYGFYLKFRASRNGLTPGHAHNHGFRLMIKLFQAHLWQVWREAEGLETPLPYAFDILKHPKGHLINPWEMTKSKRREGVKER